MLDNVRFGAETSEEEMLNEGRYLERGWADETDAFLLQYMKSHLLQCRTCGRYYRSTRRISQLICCWLTT